MPHQEDSQAGKHVLVPCRNGSPAVENSTAGSMHCYMICLYMYSYRYANGNANPLNVSYCYTQCVWSSLDGHTM